jgi:hypothetical protein
MPNSANRNNSKSSKGKGHATQPTDHENNDEQKVNSERSDLKHGSGEGKKGDPGRTSSQGRKTASGGS